MKRTTLLTRWGLAMAVLLLVASCKKYKGKEDYTSESFDLNNNAQVQIYNAIVNSSRNHVWMDGASLTGTVLTYATTFPSTPADASINSGLHAFLVRDTLSTTTQVPLTFGESFQPNANYTIFLYDTITSPKQKTVFNNIVVPSDTTARLRFANFIYNPTALPTGFDIFSVKRNAVIFSNVRETEVTEFIPYASGITDTFYIRLNGSPDNIFNYDTAGRAPITNLSVVLTPTRLRSYTLIFRGGWRTNVNRQATSPYTAYAFARQLGVFASY